MKKNSALGILFLLIGCIFLYNCQDDDEVCIDRGTSRLGIGFYNNNFSAVNTLDSITITLSDATTYKFASVDSVFIPINFSSNTETLSIKYKYNDTPSIITLTYDLNQAFISKGCGLKYEYTNLAATLGTSSIINAVETIQTSIIDEKQNHIRISFN